MSGLKLDRQVKGGPLVLTKREAANRVIDLVNALRQLTVSPSGAGTFHMGEDDATLDLSEFFQGTKVRLDGLEDRVAAAESLINTITAALANATIACNPSGGITLTFPAIDPQSLT